MIFLITFIATVSIYIIGYLTLNTFLWKDNLNLCEKILLSPPVFFVMPLIAYIVNLFFDGRILSDRFYFYIFATLYFIMICFFSFSKIKSDLLYLKDRLRKISRNLNLKKVAFIISITILISLNVYFSIRPLLIAPMLSYEGGDLFRHIMFSRQFLNGFLRSHWCYDIAPNEQPFLMHSTIAVLTRMFNFHIFDTMFILIVFQAILLPIGIAALGYKITNKFWAAQLLAFFICINGGREFVWRESWVLNIAQQQAVPGFIMRQISITLFPFFVYSIIRVFKNREEIFFKIYSSIILSILGIIHAHIFYFSIFFVFIMIILNFKDKRLVKTFLMILVIAISVSLFFYLPLIYNLLTKNLLAWQHSDERWTIILNLKRFLNYFGVVGIISISSILILPKISNRKIFISIFIAIVIIYSFTLIADIVTGEEDPIMPFRQHRFSFILYIFLSIMSVLLINFLRRIHKKFILVLFIFLFFTNINFTTENILKNSDIWCELSANEGIKFDLLFRDKENVVDKLLKISNKKDIIAVPLKISKNFVMYSGLDVVYAPWSHILLEENIPELQLERRKDIGTIYNPDTEEKVIRKLFEKYRVKYLLVFKEDKETFDNINFMEIMDEGKWLGNKDLLIYKISIQFF